MWAAQLKWEAPDEEGLVAFMVQQKGFRHVRLFVSMLVCMCVRVSE
jgi:hypothetical protein